MKSTIDFKTCDGLVKDIRSVLPVLFMSIESYERLADAFSSINFNKQSLFLNSVKIRKPDTDMIFLSLISYYDIISKYHSDDKKLKGMATFNENTENNLCTIEISLSDLIKLDKNIEVAREIMSLLENILHPEIYKNFKEIDSYSSLLNFLYNCHALKRKKAEDPLYRMSDGYHDEDVDMIKTIFKQD